MVFQRQALLWALIRLAAVGLLILPAARETANDLALYAGWLPQLASGQRPADQLWQYPVGFALLLGGLGTLGIGVPGLVLVNLAADLGILWLLRGTRGGTYWALAAAFVGPLMLMRMDSVATLLAVLGVMVAADRWRLSGVALGLGASMKLWPGVLLLVAPRQRWISRVAIAGMTVGLSALCAWLVFGAGPLLGTQGRRGLQVESLAAWPFMAARAAGLPVEVAFRNGAYEVVGAAPDLIAVLLTPISLALTLGLWGLIRRGVLADCREISSVLLVAVLLLSSRVLSPQFDVWLLALVALAMSRAVLPTLLVPAATGTALAAQVLYPYCYPDFLAGGLAGLVVQTLRLALLFVVLVAAGGAARRRDSAVSGEALSPVVTPG